MEYKKPMFKRSVSTLPIDVLTKIDCESDAPKPEIIPSKPKPRTIKKNVIESTVKNAAYGTKKLAVLRRSPSNNFSEKKFIEMGNNEISNELGSESSVLLFLSLNSLSNSGKNLLSVKEFMDLPKLIDFDKSKKYGPSAVDNNGLSLKKATSLFRDQTFH